ncbi:hypothetical protein CHU92_12940 [Flavobacterium cyanobacteriorum]|uniref:Uncharacterized protein n=1 Tax=Flavobacterium cyanobacteriorum TaxID=2022802 RepID=A0A255YVQ2_9FLAO|nr:hypothetical protein [Flavobacterium cyanobacteriorum]OYQ33293.1 hypothetical protein CHU92_12940 [Flavobacterium cyanobacteriorum]
MKKLTEEQAGHLMEFTRRHYVEYYDLQCELADHLANGIEAAWQDNPKLSFEAALQKEFKKFGIFGFSDIVEKRTVALQKKYYRLLWGYFKNFFRLPVVAGTVSAIIAVRLLLQLSHWIFGALIFSMIVIGIVRLYRLRKNYKDKLKRTGQKWLLEDTIYACGGVSVLLNVPLQLYINIKTVPSGSMLWLLSAILVLIAIYDYVVLWVLPSRSEGHLEEAYPEYKFQVTK